MLGYLPYGKVGAVVEEKAEISRKSSSRNPLASPAHEPITRSTSSGTRNRGIDELPRSKPWNGVLQTRRGTGQWCRENGGTLGRRPRCSWPSRSREVAPALSTNERSASAVPPTSALRCISCRCAPPSISMTTRSLAPDALTGVGREDGADPRGPRCLDCAGQRPAAPPLWAASFR